MIPGTGTVCGLVAINKVLVEVRRMAFEQAPHRAIAALLDAAEELPALLARSDDTTEEFRDAMAGIAELNPRLAEASDAFERCLASP